jgi:hypothetical protein
MSKRVPRKDKFLDKLIEDYDEKDIAEAMEKFLVETGTSQVELVKLLGEAYKLVKNGALPKTVLPRLTGIPWSRWVNQTGIMREFNRVHAQKIADAEGRIHQINPLAYVRQAAPEGWTPEEKLKVDANVHTKQEIDEEAILVAAKTIERRKQEEKKSHGGD